MTLIYKILSRAEWAAAETLGRFEGSAVDLADGFIHLSGADQAQETAAKWFLHDLAARALHAFDPEDAHGLAIKGLKAGLGPRETAVSDPRLSITLAGCICPIASASPPASTRTPRSPTPCWPPASASWSAARSPPAPGRQPAPAPVPPDRGPR
jgi:hypothetical protein